MSDTRFKAWFSKTGNKRTRKIPDLKSLPPKTEAFTEHSKRAHLQTAIWYSALQKNPPDIQPTDFGRIKVAVSRSLAPLEIPQNTLSAPPELLENIRCGCKTDHLCGASRCDCFSSHLPRTVFCSCYETGVCQNRLPQASAMSSDESSDDKTNDQ